MQNFNQIALKDLGLLTTEFDVKSYNTLEPWQPQIFAQFCLLLLFCTMKRKNINSLFNLSLVLLFINLNQSAQLSFLTAETKMNKLITSFFLALNLIPLLSPWLCLQLHFLQCSWFKLVTNIFIYKESLHGQ